MTLCPPRYDLTGSNVYEHGFASRRPDNRIIENAAASASLRMRRESLLPR